MTEWNSERQAGRFVEAYADVILRLCLTYSLTREDAQDICQNIFLTLLEDGRQFADEEHERAFVLRCTINACKDLLKSAGRRRNVPIEEAERLRSGRTAPCPRPSAACPSTTAQHFTSFTTRAAAWTRSPGCAAVRLRRPGNASAVPASCWPKDWRWPDEHQREL